MTVEEKNKIDELVFEGYGASKIAKELEISINTVKSYLRRKSIKDNVEKRCETCGKEIRSKVKTKRFCSNSCRNKWWNTKYKDEPRFKGTCMHCGKTFLMFRDNHKKYCTHACYIKARYGENND